MKFVATKMADQLDLQALHRVRERLVRQRPGIISQIRAFLLERDASAGSVSGRVGASSAGGCQYDRDLMATSSSLPLYVIYRRLGGSAGISWKARRQQRSRKSCRRSSCWPIGTKALAAIDHNRICKTSYRIRIS
jgi:hypothetical protein